MPNMWCDIFSTHWLKGHISSEHDNNKSYKYPFYKGIFELNISLKGHISLEHNKNKSYKCPICDVLFAVYSNGKVIYLQNMTKINLTNDQYVKEYLKCILFLKVVSFLDLDKNKSY